MARRMTWKEIQREYPDQNVCITNVEWLGKAHVGVKEAEVIAAEQETPYEDMLDMAITSNGKIFCFYTNTHPLYGSGVLPYAKG